MPWVRFDDIWPLHRKVSGLSDAGYRLASESIFWCARNLTDGRIVEDDLRSVSAAARNGNAVTELVRKGIWHDGATHDCPSCPRTEDGWVIHDYLDYQPSKAKVEAEREAKRKRQGRWLEKQRRVSNASGDASGDVPPYPPRPEGRRGALRAVPREHPTLPWCGRCDERTRLTTNADDMVCRCPDCHPLAGGDVP
jgi:hypothetical protein